MTKNKKSLLVIGALVRVIIMLLVIFLVVMPACTKLSDFFSGSGKDYLKSFEGFVEWVNNELGIDERDNFPLEIEAERAMIGFSKDADKFECINCWDDDKTLVYDKPNKEECEGTACVCLCRDELKFEEIEFEGKKAKVGKCDYLCRVLNQDIVAQTVTVDVRTNTNIIWQNGFLFGSLLPLSNGLGEGLSFTKLLYVDKTQDTIAVCNDQMLRHSDATRFGTCTTTALSISAETIEEGPEAVREDILSRTFDGFVDLINELETRGVDTSIICKKEYDLTGFDVDEFITYEKVGDKGKISLKKGQSHEELLSEEVEILVPYLIGGLFNSLFDAYFDVYIQDRNEDFKKYILRPNTREGLIPFRGHDMAIFGDKKMVVLIHKNGNWILMTDHEVGSLAAEIGELCW